MQSQGFIGKAAPLTYLLVYLIIFIDKCTDKKYTRADNEGKRILAEVQVKNQCHGGE